MSEHFLIAPAAEKDLREIIDFIARDNPDAVVKVRNEFFAAFEKLADMRRIGHVREEILDSWHRFWSVYSYLIVYRWQLRPIQIIAVVHGARNLPKLLGRRGKRR